MKKYVQTRQGAEKVGEIIATHDIGEFGFCVEIMETRTPPQNNGMHLYFQLLATALNDMGLSIHQEFLGKSIEIPFSAEWVKQNIWLPPMKAMFDKTSTAKLERREVSEIYDVLNRFFIDRHDLYIPFPSHEEPR